MADPSSTTSKHLLAKILRTLDLWEPPSPADRHLLEDLGIQPPRDLPSGPPPERWPEGIPSGNRRSGSDGRFMPFNWVTGILALALLLLLTLGAAMTVSLLEIRHSDPRTISSSRYSGLHFDGSQRPAP